MHTRAKHYAEAIGLLLVALLTVPFVSGGLPAGLIADLFWAVVIVLTIALLATFNQLHQP